MSAACLPDLPYTQAGYLFSLQRNLPFRQISKPGKTLDQLCLSIAGYAGQPYNLALLHMQAQTL